MPRYESARQLSPNIDIQGGLQMFVRKGRLTAAECGHPRIVTVRNSGIERTVCESCGHVSFRGLEGLSGTADRSQFGRIVERSGQPVG